MFLKVKKSFILYFEELELILYISEEIRIIFYFKNPSFLSHKMSGILESEKFPNLHIKVYIYVKIVQ